MPQLNRALVLKISQKYFLKATGRVALYEKLPAVMGRRALGAFLSRKARYRGSASHWSIRPAKGFGSS